MISYVGWHISVTTCQITMTLSDLYVVLSDVYVDLSDLYVSCPVNAIQITIKLSENRHNI